MFQRRVNQSLPPTHETIFHRTLYASVESKGAVAMAEALIVLSVELEKVEPGS